MKIQGKNGVSLGKSDLKNNRFLDFPGIHNRPGYFFAWIFLFFDVFSVRFSMQYPDFPSDFHGFNSDFQCKTRSKGVIQRRIRAANLISNRSPASLRTFLLPFSFRFSNDGPPKWRVALARVRVRVALTWGG